MAISEPYVNSASITATEYDLPSNSTAIGAITTDGIYQCFLDLNALAAGDVFEFKCYEKVRSASTQRVVYSARFAGVQGAPNWVSPTLVLINGWTMTLKLISATARTIEWSIRAVA